MIPFGKPQLSTIEKKKVLKVLNSGILTHGPIGAEFEKEFQKFTKLNNCLTTSSCTSALFMSYMLAGLKKGDEFIVPAQTHVSTVHAGVALGAKPVFIDSDDKTGNIDLNKIEKSINVKTKIITLVHYLGKPVDIKKILYLKKKYKIKIIEDCALSLGANYYGKHVGYYSDYACFSFYPAKHITTGDGGMIFCKKKSDYKKAKLLRGFGVNKNFFERKVPGIYDVVNFGLNFRLSDINSAIGLVQIKRLKNFLELRKKNYSKLYSELKNINKIKIVENFTVPNLESSYYCFSLIIKNSSSKIRNKILLDLKKKKIGCSVHYPKIVPDFLFYKKKLNLNKKNFKFANILSEYSINLPVGPHLSSKNIEKVIYEFKKIIRKY